MLEWARFAKPRYPHKDYFAYPSDRDWDALATLYDAFKANPTAANTNWSNEALNYANNNSNASYSDLTTYAGLKLYGNAIIITKKDSASGISSPMEIDANGIVVKTPCP